LRLRLTACFRTGYRREPKYAHAEHARAASVMIAIWIILYNVTSSADQLSAGAAFMIYFAATCLAGLSSRT